MIGGGMSHKGMFRRKVGNNFRYLHDEISGGLVSVSHLKTKESYIGDALVLNTGGTSDAYGFVDNIVDLSSAQLDYPSPITANVFDQINNVASNLGPNNVWNGSDFLASFKRITSMSPINLSDAKTIVYVINLDTLSGLQGIGGLWLAELRYQQIYFSGSTMVARKRGDTQFDTSYSGASTGLQLLIWTDDGSLSSSGQNVYKNDMTTALTPSGASGTSGDYTFTANEIARVAQSGLPVVQGIVAEYHVFNHSLSESQRITTKEILEQYYTFS